MKISDDDLGLADLGKEIIGHEFAALVIAVRIVWLEHSETVTDREARRHYEKSARELLAARATHCVDGLPGNDHRHDGSLARPGRELQSKPHQSGISLVVGRFEMLDELSTGAIVRRYFGEPDERLNRFDLA